MKSRAAEPACKLRQSVLEEEVACVQPDRESRQRRAVVLDPSFQESHRPPSGRRGRRNRPPSYMKPAAWMHQRLPGEVDRQGGPWDNSTIGDGQTGARLRFPRRAGHRLARLPRSWRHAPPPPASGGGSGRVRRREHAWMEPPGDFLDSRHDLGTRLLDRFAHDEQASGSHRRHA